MYKDKQFRVRKKEEVLEDFQMAYDTYGDRIRRIFLADGDALIVRTPDLLDILNFIRENSLHRAGDFLWDAGRYFEKIRRRVEVAGQGRTGHGLYGSGIRRCGNAGKDQ